MGEGMSTRAAGVYQRIKGPVVALNICFNEDGSVDYEAVKRYVDWLGDNGAPIVLLTSGSSEYGSLTEDEVWRLTADIAEANAGRALFITASNHWKTSKTREFLKHADRVGADAVKVQMHKGLPLDGDVYSGYFDTIEDASDIPLLLLDAVPPVSLAAELAKRPNIVGAKIHNLQWYYELTRATLDEEFAVISAGQMKNMVQVHQVGSPAYLCPIAPFLPSVAFEFYDLVDARRYDDAWQMVFKYEEPWLSGAKEIGWMASIKTAIYLRGLYPNNRPCPPMPAPTDETVVKVRDILEEVFGPIENVDL